MKLVRMSRELKRGLRRNGSGQHVREFGKAIGIAVPFDWGHGVVGPEVEVYWLPDGLHYLYSPEDLATSRKKLRHRQWASVRRIARRFISLKEWFE